MKPLVTVVTATWGRPNVVRKHAIPSVECQTYPNIEHIVVVDGVDPVMNRSLLDAGYSPESSARRLLWLGRNWTGFSGDGGIGAVPRLVGSYMASGDYIAYLDDDNDWAPHHIEKFVNLLEEKNVDIVLCPWGEYKNLDVQGPIADTNTFLHKAELLKKRSWGFDGYCGDSVLVSSWINQHHATWAWHDEHTVTLNRFKGGNGAVE